MFVYIVSEYLFAWKVIFKSCFHAKKNCRLHDQCAILSRQEKLNSIPRTQRTRPALPTVYFSSIFPSSPSTCNFLLDEKFCTIHQKCLFYPEDIPAYQIIEFLFEILVFHVKRQTMNQKVVEAPTSLDGENYSRDTLIACKRFFPHTLLSSFALIRCLLWQIIYVCFRPLRWFSGNVNDKKWKG